MFPDFESYFSVLMLFGASQAVTGIILLLKPKNVPFSNRLLALLLFLWGFSCYWFFAFIQGKPFFSREVTTFIGPMLSLTLFPPIYLFVKYLFFEYDHFQKKDHLHFVPIYIYLLFTSYLFIDSDFSIEAMRHHSLYKPRVMASSLVSTFLGPFYFFKTARILKRRQQMLEAEYSEIESLKLRWFQLVNYSFALVFIIGGASTFVNFYIDPFALYMGYHAVIALCLLYITLMIYKYPILFTLPPKHEEIFTEEIPVFLNDPNDKEEDVYSEPVTLKEQDIIAKMRHIMQTQKLYRNPNLSLNDLSQAISESRNSISHTLNKSLNKSFYQYVNELRVTECKRLLSDPSLAHFTIEGIAMESGFKTMSVFYKFFKEMEDVTPAVFRKRFQS